MRLLVEDVLNRHSEIHDIEMKEPILVVGIPRSGATHFLSLLAVDSRFLSLPLWESYEVLHAPGKERPGAWHATLIRLADGFRAWRSHESNESRSHSRKIGIDGPGLLFVCLRMDGHGAKLSGSLLQDGSDA